jgi:steroid delta-isomerase-like uncharacterized protein
MSETAMDTVATDEVIVSVLAHLRNGRIDDAIACFADDFAFNDYGIGLEFKNKERLAEFFKKTREYFPDLSLEIDSILVGVDHEIGEWTLRTTVTETFTRALSRNYPVLLRGVSVVRTRDGKISEWADYYSGLESRRTALASYFTDWVEL